MNIIVVGTNHKISPIEIREKFSFPKKNLHNALSSLLDFRAINAGVIVSTCNRVELYATADDAKTGVEALREFLTKYHNQKLSIIELYLYTYIGKEAIEHLFQVACGLDSQIIGEEQILEQVKFAYQEAKQIEATDRFLEAIFERAVRTSLKVRQETQIQAGDVSLASIVLDLIKTKFRSFSDKRVLIIGVGKVSQVLIRRLKEEGLKSVFIANKTFLKAKRLAESINAEIVRFDRLREKLQDTDIIISATSSPHLILKKKDVLEVLNYRLSLPVRQAGTIDCRLLIIDLAVPRDVDPDIKYIKGVSLFCLDDLNFIIEDSLKRRRQEIPAALEIIKKEVENLCLEEPLESEPAGACLP